MWICNRCQQHNKEGDSQCIQCASPRHARRFGAGTAVETPSIELPPPSVQPARASNADAEYAASPEGRMPRVTLQPPRRVVRCPAGRALTGLGVALCVLLPTLTIWLAVVQADAWSPLAAGLLFPRAVPQTDALRLGGYIAFSLVAVLVSLLPGIGALGMGRLLIRLTPPQLVRD